MKEGKMIPELRFHDFNEKWKSCRIGDLTDIKSASRVLKNQWMESGVPFYRTSDVVAEYKGLENRRAFISIELFNELSKKSGRVSKNDLLVTGGGSIGIPFLIKTDDPLYFKDADLLWFKNTKQLNGAFLYSYFLTRVFRKYLRSITHTGTISHYTIEQAKSTPIKIPTYREQQKIASFFSAIDKKIEQLTRKKELLEQYKKGVMQKLFSQESFKDDNGQDYPDWEKKKLGKVANFRKGRGISKDDVVVDGKLKCIRYGELYTHYKEVITTIFSTTDMDEKILELSERNDLIIPSSGETHIDLATASCVTSDGVALGGDINIIRSNENGIFLSYYLNNAMKIKVAKLAQGTSVIHLYATHLKSLKLRIPKKKEQEKIADFLSSIDKKLNTVQTQLNQTQTFKKGLLQKMFV